MITCRFCASGRGTLVLDAGPQPAADHFPAAGDPGPDPLYPLRMWLCAGCGLAQLVEDPTEADEPRGQEPEALLRQADDAVGRLSQQGYLRPGGTVVEFGSPHGGSWLDLLTARGMTVASDGPADVVIDNLGLMHEADQAAALRARAVRLAPDGALFLQYHSLATIIRLGQWNALRHGHYAYFSTPSLVGMLRAVGLEAFTAHRFPLYGGSVLLGARRGGVPDEALTELVAEETAGGVLDPDRVRALQADTETTATALAELVRAERAAGRTVAAYSAASRAVALLCAAGLGPADVPIVADASPAKAGRRMPGSGIPIVTPAELVRARPDVVVLFVPDLLPEVRRALPEIERSGGRWVVAEATEPARP